MSPKGFTLIEMMIVVAIIGILSMFAVVIYVDYVKRVHVAEGINLASSIKVAVVDTFATKGDYPSSNIDAGLADASKIKGNAVTSVDVGAFGIITITYNSKVTTGPATIVLIPTNKNSLVIGEPIKWDCVTDSTLDIKYRPIECR